MLTVIAGTSLLATLFSGWRNMGQWQEYHRGHLSRGQLVNKIFVTCVLGAVTIALFVVGRMF